MDEVRSIFKTLMIGLSLLTCGCSQNTIDERGPSREVSNTTSAQLDSPVGVDRRLYNGIVLPEKWPPHYGEISRDPMPVPYLTDPPAVIPIDVGRQLFVDDFLIETTTLSRTFHQAEYCAENPVIRCDKLGDYLTPFSGGAWYDPDDNLFKIWYSGGENTVLYATSKDGIHWKTPKRNQTKKTSDLARELACVLVHPEEDAPFKSIAAAFAAGGDSPLKRVSGEFGSVSLKLPRKVTAGDKVSFTAIDAQGKKINLSTLQHVEIGFGEAGFVLDDRGTLDTASGNGVFTMTAEMLASDRFDFFAVNPAGKTNRAESTDHANVVLHPESVNSSTVWLDHRAANTEEKFKYFASEDFHIEDDEIGWFYTYRSSADGVHWSEPKEERARIWGDRSTAFYNPFRDVWVLSQRTEDDKGRRTRSYIEGPTVGDLMSEVTYNGPHIEGERMVLGEATGESVNWTGADKLDPRHTDSRFSEIAPQLYNLDAAPYESLMIGQFSIWQGPSNEACGVLNLQKRNDILLGFSRDGFHWDRPSRERFISSTWDASSWRYGNVQSCAGGPLVVGDKLYFYFSGHAKPRQGDAWDRDASTGLAMLRRDGFASMNAGKEVGTLTTRPVTFRGKQLFVNVDCPEGELTVEVLDEGGNAIEPFTLKNCDPVSVDKTLAEVNWQEDNDLSALVGKRVRFRFHLKNGALYAFWVSPDESGASNGYVGAGGPGFAGPRDAVGRSAAGAKSQQTESGDKKAQSGNGD
ncbi:hypothetical protein N9239_00805 [bacterium]|nr:hypothetical protein [Rhodopirellula sp.]MDB4445999.1 hypothetical protein [bacterium]MDB4500537.1 hypothetical protein [bacterium]